ncbi:MAG: hypothetical protein HYX96_06790 [Chloroflexi bacterium]|nr:hypothetical protein [Chloroflexota bacterium]
MLAALAAFLALCLAVPVQAAGFGVSPSRIELKVPAGGQASVEFKLYDFSGDVLISAEDIPLRISPGLVRVSPENNRVAVTFYGDGSAVTRVYEGKILFLAAGGTRPINMGVKVKARVINAAEGGVSPGHIWLFTLAGALLLGCGMFLVRRYRYLLR